MSPRTQKLILQLVMSSVVIKNETLVLDVITVSDALVLSASGVLNGFLFKVTITTIPGILLKLTIS